MSAESRPLRVRREPPPLRPITVVERTELSPRLLRLTIEGPELAALEVDGLAASVRLLVPRPGESLVLPTWDGNEFLLPDGSRPALRTFTPLRHSVGSTRMDLEIVRHPGGAVSTWAETAEVGATGALSGPGRGWHLDDATTDLWLLGDETALAAVTQIVETLPSQVSCTVHIEVESADAVLEGYVPARPGLDVHWHVNTGAPGSSLVEAVTSLTSAPENQHVWAAGEAASMQAIRKHLFEVAGAARSQATVRGYWKPARD